MRVSVSTPLDCSVEAAWSEVLKPSTLRRVAYPMVTFRPSRASSFPRYWEEGRTYYLKSYLFGVIPVGERRVFVERRDPVCHEIQTRETDHLVKTWDHLMTIGRDRQGSTVYSDEIDIHAGWLTPLVWTFASIFYRHRQSRWRARARSLRLDHALPGAARVLR